MKKLLRIFLSGHPTCVVNDAFAVDVSIRVHIILLIERAIHEELMLVVRDSKVQRVSVCNDAIISIRVLWIRYRNRDIFVQSFSETTNRSIWSWAFEALIFARFDIAKTMEAVVKSKAKELQLIELDED